MPNASVVIVSIVSIARSGQSCNRTEIGGLQDGRFKTILRLGGWVGPAQPVNLAIEDCINSAV
jgi:hypothetical protein